MFQNVFGLSGTQGISNGGTGYTVGDTLTVTGGTLGPNGTASVVKVATISGGGGTGPVATVTISNRGAYKAKPSSPVSVTGGTGTGAKITPNWIPFYWGFTGVFTTFDLTAAFVGVWSPLDATNCGYDAGVYGALNPPTVSGNAVSLLTTTHKADDSWTTLLFIDATLSQNFFSTIVVNGFTLDSSSASYLSGPFTSWEWPGLIVFPSAGSYPLTMFF